METRQNFWNSRKTFNSKSWTNLFMICFFIASFIFGVCTFRDYGLEPDDITERRSSVITFNHVFPYSCKGEACPEELNLYDWEDRYYGTFLQQWTVLPEYLRHYQMDLRTVYWIRHFWIFLNVFISQIVFYFLLKKRFGSAWAGFLGVLFFIFCPRLFANSFYNIKDMLFYPWFVFSLFFLQKLLDHPDWKMALVLGIVSAVSANTRIIGAAVPFFGVLFVLQDGFLKRISWKKAIVTALTLFLSAFSFWILITPMAWHDPLQCLSATLHFFSYFERMKGYSLLYMGKFYLTSQLPWHYLPVWILISCPILDLVLTLTGIVIYVLNIRKITWSPNDQLELTFILIMIMVPGYVLIRRPVLYDGWRHFYFLFALMDYFMIYGIAELLKKKSKAVNIILLAGCLASFGITGTWMVQNHPYEGTYFNPVFRSWGLHDFARDYWLLSTKECLEFTAKYTDADVINVWDDGAAVGSDFYFLDPQTRARFNSISYGAGGKPMDFLFSSSYRSLFRSLDGSRTYPFYKMIYSVKTDGVILSAVFERDHTDEMQPYDVIREIRSNVNPDQTGAIFDSDRTTGWTTGRPQQAGDYLEIYLDKNYDLYGISAFWEKQDGGFAHSLAIDISNDGGKTWQPTELTTANRTDFAFNPIPGNALRLRLTADNEYPWYMNYLWIYGK